MTTPFGYTLIPDPGGEDGTVGAGPAITPGALVQACDPVHFDQAAFLALMDRLLPDSYLTPIKEIGPGYELLQAYAKIFERVSLAIGRLECCQYYGSAEGGARSVVLVEFLRSNAAAGAVTVLAGAIVRASRGGQQFRVLADAVFGALALGPVAVEVEAVADGWEWNVPGLRLTAASEVLRGEIDTIELPLQSPPYTDASIQVQQIADATGGHAPCLDGLGEERDMPRQPGETDANYSVRLRTLPDVVTPGAIARQLDRYLGQRSIAYDYIETWELRYQTCWDAPSSPIPGSDFDPNLFTYDDPRDPVPFRNRWLDSNDHRAAFIVVVPDLAAFEDHGMAYDDSAVTVADHTTEFGRRAHAAYDVPLVITADVLQGAYDGGTLDGEKRAFYLQLWQTLEEIKLGGTLVALEREGE